MLSDKTTSQNAKFAKRKEPSGYRSRKLFTTLKGLRLMEDHELAIANNHLSEGHAFYRCGEQCVAASNEVSIKSDELKN
ncbi:MAG: hypothetical protein ACI9LG_002499 [Moritella dasanensis]|jgi:hypothetical protein